MPLTLRDGIVIQSPSWCVLEHQHQYGRRCSESGENRDGILVEQSAYPDDDAYSYGDELEHLIEAAQRMMTQSFLLGTGPVKPFKE